MRAPLHIVVLAAAAAGGLGGCGGHDAPPRKPPALEPGANVIDVIATAPRRKAALTALRVTRDILVTVPQLADVEEEELERVLEPLGLRAEVQRGGGILDVLRSGPTVVCEQDPPAGARVRRGRTIQVVVAKRC